MKEKAQKTSRRGQSREGGSPTLSVSGAHSARSPWTDPGLGADSVAGLWAVRVGVWRSSEGPGLEVWTRPHTLPSPSPVRSFPDRPANTHSSGRGASPTAGGVSSPAFLRPPSIRCCCRASLPAARARPALPRDALTRHGHRVQGPGHDPSAQLPGTHRLNRRSGTYSRKQTARLPPPSPRKLMTPAPINPNPSMST